MNTKPASTPTGAPALSSKELFLRACRQQPVPRVPVWMMRQAGRYLPEYRAIREKHSFLEVAKTPDLAAEVSLQPHRRLGVDAVIVFSDILIVAEAMGAPIELGDAGPIVHSPIRTAEQVEALSEFDPESKTKFLGDTIRRLCGALGPDVPVLGTPGIGGAASGPAGADHGLRARDSSDHPVGVPPQGAAGQGYDEVVADGLQECRRPWPPAS